MQNYAKEYLGFDKKYQTHVTKFITYLSLPEVNKDDKPSAITQDDVDGSVGYYASLGAINSVESMKNHLESIKAFYNYLIEKEYWPQNIIKDVGYDDFKKSLIIKYNLKKLKPRAAILDDEVRMILETLDEVLDCAEYRTKKPAQYLNRMVLRIYIKLCLIAPAKKNVLVALQYSAFEDSMHTIEINGVKAKIPSSLRKNIIDTIDLFESDKGRSINKEDKIFEFLTGEGKSKEIDTKLCGWFCTFLKENNYLDVPKTKTTYSVEIINNTAISNLVNQGTDPALISKIAGITIAQLEKKYYKTKSVSAYEEINFEIAKSNYYNYI